MVDAANYFTTEVLRDGRRIEIRAFKPDDRADLLSAAASISALSHYRRFFAVKSSFTDREIEFFLNVDFVDHVALVALAEETERKVIIGGGRYVVVKPGTAEVAFIVVDQYQRQGIGAALLHHLALIARASGLKSMIAEVLPENMAMLRVFERCGLPMTTIRNPEVVHVTLQLV
jgi:RimJ/RimL family protein N-acetyltransferase